MFIVHCINTVMKYGCQYMLYKIQLSTTLVSFYSSTVHCFILKRLRVSLNLVCIYYSIYNKDKSYLAY